MSLSNGRRTSSAETVLRCLFDDDNSDMEYFFDGIDDEFNDSTFGICEEVTVGDVSEKVSSLMTIGMMRNINIIVILSQLLLYSYNA